MYTSLIDAIIGVVISRILFKNRNTFTGIIFGANIEIILNSTGLGLRLRTAVGFVLDLLINQQKK